MWRAWEPTEMFPWVDVMPDEDLVGHEAGEVCVCGPEVTYFDEDGTALTLPMFSHHMLAVS